MTSEHEQPMEMVSMELMANPEEILRYQGFFNDIPWQTPDAARVALGRVLCGDYGCLKATINGNVKALVIFQNQLAQDPQGRNVVNLSLIHI